MTSVYYFFKPVLPQWFRVRVRSFIIRRVSGRFNDFWPIVEAAGVASPEWKGWPNGKRFAFVVTHDVEGARGLARCEKLVDLDTALGIRSSFNFVPEGEYRVSDALRESLTQSGFEVGVHDLHHDGSLYRSFRRFQMQAEKINRHLKAWEAGGFRSGFMFHNLEWLQALDVQYDASTFDVDPFEPQPDGVETIFPFWVQGPGSKGFVELPYTLPQDSTLFLLLKERTIDLWRKKLDWIAEKGGMALVIVHPDYLCFDGKPDSSEYPVELYESLLKYVTTRYADQCWFALPREIAAFVAQTKPRLRRPDAPAPIR